MLIWLRNIAYSRGWLPVVPSPLPTISVGNLTMGGTGKTPVTQALAQYCLARGLCPGILLRGYRRRSRGMVVVSRGNGPEVPWTDSGDEAWLHAWKLPAAIVIADRRRERAAAHARELGAHVLLIDDGFQYRRLHRDIDLVLVDCYTLRRPRVFPCGWLREPLSALQRAHVLLLNGIDPEELPPWSHSIPWVQVIFHHSQPMVWSQNGAEPLSAVPEEPVVAFAGIAHPGRFRFSLEAAGWRIASWHPFPDHHPYRLSTLQALLRQCHRHGSQWLVTTEKDFVRLRPLVERIDTAGVKLVTLGVRAEFGKGAAALWDLLDRVLTQARSELKDLPQHTER